MEKSLDLPGCQRCRSCPSEQKPVFEEYEIGPIFEESPSDSEQAPVFEEYEYEAPVFSEYEYVEEGEKGDFEDPVPFQEYGDEYDGEDVQDCRICFDIIFDHPECGQCQSCPGGPVAWLLASSGGPVDTARFRKIRKKLKNRKRKNKWRRKDKKKRTIAEREGRQTESAADSSVEEVQLPTISGGALGANT